MTTLPVVEGIFQVTTVGNKSMVRQLYPNNGQMIVRVPELSLLSFVITIRLTGSDEISGKLPLYFYEYFKNRGDGDETIPFRQFRQQMGEWPKTADGQAYAFSTLPLGIPVAALFGDSMIGLGLTNPSGHDHYFDIQFQFQIVKLRGGSCDNDSFGVNINYATWIPSDPIKASHIDSQNHDIPSYELDRSDSMVPPRPHSIANDDAIMEKKIDDEFSEMSDECGQAECFEEEDDEIESESAYENVAIPETSPSASSFPASSIALVQQVGSLLIGSKVGQMVVTAGASAVSISEFDASRIRTRYSCSPMYMLGVEYRMLGPRNQRLESVETERVIPVTQDIGYAIANVLLVTGRKDNARINVAGSELLIKELIDFGDKISSSLLPSMHDWFDEKGWAVEDYKVGQSLAVQCSSSPSHKSANQYSLTVRQLPKNVLELSLICIPNIPTNPNHSFSLGSVSRRHSLIGERDAAAAMAYYSEVFNKFIKSGQMMLQEVANIPRHTMAPSFKLVPPPATAQIIPHSLASMKDRKRKRVGGQCYYWSPRLHNWLLQSLRVIQTSLHINALVDAKNGFELFLPKCQLLRSGDGSHRFALVDTRSGHKHIFKTFSRDDFQVLSKLLECMCLPEQYEVDEEGKKDDSIEWMEQNSGIIGEFIYDFQSRFWFTYRRNFERIGPTLLSTDAGWGCMLRTGQSMMAEAMARVVLSRGNITSL